MPDFDPKLLDQLMAGANPEDLFASEGLFKKLKTAMAERMLEAEMTHHLGYEKNDPAGNGSGNSRNGHTKKTVTTDDGQLQVQVPRDRDGSFEPVAIPKRARRTSTFNRQVIALYARGMTQRDIRDHLEEMYGTEVSTQLISAVTDAVWADVQDWQNRLLEPVWPIVYLDALVVKVRDNGIVRNKAIYLALGVTLEGRKEVLGLWVSQTEGAKFWLHVLTELKNRGVTDILITCCDGLTGFPEAIEAAFPQATVQTCIVHQIRNSLKYVSYKRRKTIAKDLKPIYQAPTVAAAEAAMDAFEAKWGADYPSIVASWRKNWETLTAFLAFAEPIRRAIYTTNAIESLNRQLRKALKTRGHFPTDEAALKLMWLALDKAKKNWKMPIREWDLALQQLSVHFPNRLPL